MPEYDYFQKGYDAYGYYRRSCEAVERAKEHPAGKYAIVHYPACLAAPGSEEHELWHAGWNKAKADEAETKEP